MNYGELVCITGETGSGKSTLLKQLAGVIDIKGQINFIPQFQSDRKEPLLSYVPQSPTIINDTVKSLADSTGALGIKPSLLVGILSCANDKRYLPKSTAFC